jgi:hypothetical protein
METGAAIAIGAGALVLVFLVTRQQEQQTAAMIALAQKKQQEQQGDGALSFKQLFQGGAIAVATYFGGPAAGSSAAKAVL